MIFFKGGEFYVFYVDRLKFDVGGLSYQAATPTPCKPLSNIIFV